jgi:LPPG:FO 2-phospho-L-lactate transferase
VLAGGVGAARLLRGLAPLVRPSELSVIVNTADDDTFFGLSISPDIDTVLYTFAGLADPIRGWGIATHLFRTERLGRGDPLSTITVAQARALGVATRVLPMTDDRVRTIVDTTGGRRSFQEYLVRDRARETVRAISYAGARRARPAPGVLAAIEDASLLVVAPSNPLVSIGPILAVPGIRAALRRAGAPVVAVSPLIGGRAVKGPGDKMMRALGLAPNPLSIAEGYADFLDAMVIDSADRTFVPRLAARGLAVTSLDTLMRSPVRATAVARAVLELGSSTERRRTLAV